MSNALRKGRQSHSQKQFESLEMKQWSISDIKTLGRMHVECKECEDNVEVQCLLRLLSLKVLRAAVTPPGAAKRLAPSGRDIRHQCRVSLNEAFTNAAFLPHISMSKGSAGDALNSC